MSDNYIEIVTWNRKMILLHGDKLTRTQKAIGLRSNGLHVELNFVDRGQYFSCTCADDVDGCRFKPIKRMHPYRQSVVRIPVTQAQEAALWAKACSLADMPVDIHTWGNAHLHYGPKHTQYDTYGASFSFISRLQIWKMDKEKMICNEAVANVMLVVWPDLLMVKGDNIDSIDWPLALDPATLTPDQFEYMARHYFDNKTVPLI